MSKHLPVIHIPGQTSVGYEVVVPTKEDATALGKVLERKLGKGNLHTQPSYTLKSIELKYRPKGKMPDRKEFVSAVEGWAKSKGYSLARDLSELKRGLAQLRTKTAGSVDAVVERVLTAAIIPKNWWKTQQDKFKAVLSTPLKDSPESWGWVFPNTVLPLFDGFQRAFEDIVQLDQARESIALRVQSAKTYIEALSEKFPKSINVNFEDPESYLRWYALTEIYERMHKLTPTYADVFKTQWSVDLAAVDKLVRTSLKKASPEELRALTSDSYYRAKYAFLERVGFSAAALKLLKKTKLDWSPLKWVAGLEAVVDANFSERALGDNSGYREFDLQGIKVIVDDKTVDNSDVEKYVDLLKSAHARLKSKGFGKAWYGNVFIQCVECGGTNSNNGGGVGGWYETQKDTVTIFSRPSPFIVELMVHELGHRYWFKQMSSAGRAKFEDLVKVHTKPRPHNLSKNVRILRSVEVAKEKKRITDALATATHGLKQVVTPGAKHPGRILFFFGADLVDVITTWDVKDPTPRLISLKDAVYESRKGLSSHDADYSSSVDRNDPATVEAWLKEALALANQAAESALEYIDLAAKFINQEAMSSIDERGKDWLDSYESNPAPVAPVSTYGASNIDEAFAEVFTHYVLEYDITQDQVESFRSVLASGSVDAVVASVLTAKVLDLAWVESLRKDFLTLMKNIPRVKDYQTGQRLREAFKVFKERFHFVMFESFLNRDLKYNLGVGESEADYLGKKIRTPAWDLYSDLGSLPLWPVNEHHSEASRLSEFEREVPKWEARIKRRAQAFWPVMKDFVTWYERNLKKPVNVDAPEPEKVDIEGFKVILLNFKSGDEANARNLFVVQEGLRVYRKKASTHAPILLKKQVPIFVQFSHGLDKGGNYSQSEITLFASGSVTESPDKVAHVIAHEMGHHLFKTYLSQEATESWTATIKGDYGDLDIQELLRQWPGDAWAFEMSKKIDDPILGLQVEAVLSDVHYDDLNTKEDFEALLTKGTRTLRVPMTPITGYANKNPEEAFCEAIGMLVAYGPRAVHEKVRMWLENVMPGAVKVAATVDKASSLV